MRDVSVVVVTHNSEAEIGGCLDALRKFGEVIVVDNASLDRTVSRASSRAWVEVAANTSNRGFGAAVNQGVRLAKGRFILVLNPDAVIVSDCRNLVEACEREGLAAGCLINADGSPQTGFSIRRLPTPATLIFECLGINRAWPGNPVNVRYRYLGQDFSQPCRVEQPAGAFLMIRRDIFDKLGGFDEQFWPVWFEDVDLCRRAANAGYKIEFVPEAKAQHLGAHSVGKLNSEYQHLYWYGSLLRYTGKHCNRVAFRAVACSVVLGSLLRWSSGIMGMGHGSKDLKGEYNKVLRLAVASLIAGNLVCPVSADDGEDGRKCLISHPIDGK